MNNDNSGTLRVKLIFGLLMCAVVGLGANLWLMLRRSQAADKLALKQQRRTIPIPARPGNIFASVGGRYALLAGSRHAPGCFADPYIIPEGEIPKVADGLSRALGLSVIDVQNKLVARGESRFVWIKKNISDAEASAVRSLGLRSVGICYQWRRQYPNGPLGGTVVGFRRIDGVPGGGLELAADEYLSAEDGRRVVITDARRRPICPVLNSCEQANDGGHVFLTIDLIIQEHLQRAVSESVEKFDARWGTGVVVEPQSGKILAMCSAPSFDPNVYYRSESENRTNRAINMPYEPGSAIKPIFAAAAVDAGLMTYDTRIFCENGVYHARRGGRISDHGTSYGHLSLTDVVVHSSNIGMAKVGERMGNRRLFATAERFGFGSGTGTVLPGESPGIVRPLNKWDGYSTRRVPFGQEISVTALQLGMAFGAVANGGLLLRPRLIDHVIDSDGSVVYRSRREVVRRVLKPQTAARTLEVMHQVIERGTGRKCRLSRWKAFGKTGTGQIAGRGGYVDGAYTGSFVGGAPLDKPRLVCLISIYWPDRSKGYYGGTVAAPYVKRVLENSLLYLGVPGDSPEVLVGR